jgi:hypothetical protein
MSMRWLEIECVNLSFLQVSIDVSLFILDHGCEKVGNRSIESCKDHGLCENSVHLNHILCQTILPAIKDEDEPDSA